MKKYILLVMLATVLTVLAACGAKTDDSAKGKEEKSKKEATTEQRTITYLGDEYKIPKQTDRIVIIGSVEALEDAEVLGVKPVGSFTTGGAFPDKFASTVLSDAEPVGEKTEPNAEAILKLKPDVILMSTKYPDEVKEKIGKLGTVLPYSHISTDWKSNLNMLGDITGKQDAAKKAIAEYGTHLDKVKAELGADKKKKSILALRIRQGNLFIYPQNVFMNDALYNELGFKVPSIIKPAKAQEQLPLEKMSDVNPDYIFLQYEATSNADEKDALKELEKNPIWTSLNAVKEGHVYVNAMDSILEGGPLLSREEILKAVDEKLVK